MCSFVFLENFSISIWLLQFLTTNSVIIHASLLFKYTSFYTSIKKEHCELSSQMVSIISANEFYNNKHYDVFLKLIDKHNPDIILTMDSDQNWEKALEVLEVGYKYNVKKSLDNTYDMHL